MLQTFRTCESKFFLDFVEGYKRKGGDKAWWFDFGILFHKMIEKYYLTRKKPNFDTIKWAFEISKSMWEEMNMDALYGNKDLPTYHKNYDLLGGLRGFQSLLLQYATLYHGSMEHWDVIGTELYFGKDKSVPLTTESDAISLGFHLYLCGKIDLLVGEATHGGGIAASPMDHKTTGNFMGKNTHTTYEVHEGMTGYVYAANQLIKSLHPAPVEVNKIWMNYVQVKPETDSSKRFKRVPLYKTAEQLEQYRLRQISTAKRILQLLNPTGVWDVPNFNTSACNHYYPCTYHSVHRQNSLDSQFKILNADFIKGPIWDPEAKDVVQEN